MSVGALGGAGLQAVVNCLTSWWELNLGPPTRAGHVLLMAEISPCPPQLIFKD